MNGNPGTNTPQPEPQVLKTDLFGQITREHRQTNGNTVEVIARNITLARWWLKPLARALAEREARVLRHLPQAAGLPTLLAWDGRILYRSYVAGSPMQAIKPKDEKYFKSARSLLRVLHRAGIAHNDTAKEPNWLVLPDGTAGLVDFQLARYFSRRSKFFRVLAFEDVRHLLKHKRSYRKEYLTRRETYILAHPALHTRVWRATGKKLYLFVTRRVLRWRDREGANDRNL